MYVSMSCGIDNIYIDLTQINISQLNDSLFCHVMLSTVLIS